MSDAPVAVDLHGFQCPPPGTVETPDEEGELHGPPPGTAETPDEDAGDQKEQTPAQEGEQTTSPARAASNVKTTGAGSTSKDGSKEQHHVQEGGQTIASVKRTGSTSKDGSSKEVASSGGGQDALALLRQLGGDDVLEQNSGPLAGTAANVSAGSRASSAAQTMSDMSPTKIDIEIQTALGLSSAGASSTLSQLNEHQLSAASPFPGQIPDEESNIPALPPASSYPKHQRSLAPSTRTGNSEDMDALDQPVVVESSSASSITWCNSNGDAVLRSSLNARSSSSRRHRSQRLLNTDNMQEVLKAPRRMTHRSNMRHLTRVAAGHAGDVVKEVFGEKTSGFILKKKDPIEAANYEKLFSDSADPLQNWTPLYGGQTKDPEGNEYLRLENLTSQDYEAAYVLDCKIGVRTFLESEARNEKLREDLFMKAEALAPWLLTDEEIERGTITKFRWMTIHDSQTTTIKEGWRIDGCAGSGTSITKSELQRNKTREDAIKFLSTVYMDLVAPSTGNDATTPEQGGTKGQLSSSSDGQQLHQASSAASQQDPPTTTTLLESEGRPPNMRVLSSPSSPSASDADPSSKGSPHSMGVRNDDQHRRTGHIFNGNGSTEGDWDKKKIKEEDETEDRSGVPSGGEATGAPTGQGTEAELGEPAQDITNTNEKKDKEKVPKENPNSKVVENVSVRGLPADGTRHDLSVPEGHGASTSVGVGGSSLMKDVVYAVRTSIASRLLQRKRVGSETDQKNDDGAHGRDIFAGGNANIVPGMPSNASAPAGPCLKNMHVLKGNTNVQRGNTNVQQEFETEDIFDHLLAELEQLNSSTGRIDEKCHQVRLRICDSFVNELESLRADMLVSSFFRTHEFIGCSLLLIADRNGKCGVSLIDLAKTNLTAAPLDHRSPWELGNHEDGLLLGVENMIRAWTAVRRLLTLSRSKSNAAQLQLLVGGGVPSAGHKGSGAKSGGVVGHAAASSSTTVLTGTPRSSAVAESIKSILFASSSCKTTAERMRMPMPVAPQNTTNVDHGAPHSSYGSGEGGDEDDGERRETRPSRRRTFAHFRERMRSTVVFGRFSLPPAITWASDALSPVFVPSEKSAIQRMLSAQTRRVGKKRTPPPPESEEDANVDKTLDEQEAQDATCCGMCRRR